MVALIYCSCKHATELVAVIASAQARHCLHGMAPGGRAGQSVALVVATCAVIVWNELHYTWTGEILDG